MNKKIYEDPITCRSLEGVAKVLIITRIVGHTDLGVLALARVRFADDASTVLRTILIPYADIDGPVDSRDTGLIYSTKTGKYRPCIYI